MELPSFSQLKQLFSVLRGLEKKLFLIFCVLAVLSAIYLLINFYIISTRVVPAYGGTYIEGVVGQPRFINPIYGETNDIDRTLIGLVYSGLMTYDNNGKIINDLAESYQISEDGKTYSFQLKNNIFWQDGEKLTADDIIYTIKTIQNSDYKSPLRADWLNIDIAKTSDTSFAMSLGTPYSSFLENCTIKIIPEHIWKNVPAEDFALSRYNLQPVGSGFYTVSGLQQNNTGFIENITLSTNYKYFGKAPYISRIIFKFFDNKEDLISSANQKNINGFSLSSLDNDQALAQKQIRQGWNANEKFNIYSFSLPRYFAVFFNQQSSKILTDKNIDQALNYAVNTQELAQKISEQFKENVTVVNSPILPKYFGYSEPTVSYSFDITASKKLLDKSGFKETDSGVRAKQNTKKPAFQFKSYLKIGSSGSEVTQLQGCLAKLDPSFASLMQNETSGKYGQGTGDAVTTFQEKYMPNTTSTGEVGTSTRKELNARCFTEQNNLIPLQFTLVTINQPQLVATANLLKEYWQAVGVSAQINAVSLSDLKDIIKNRDYDALLYGQALGSLPDVYPFWYSTQINDPGLNLCQYQSKTADKFIKDARQALNEEIKIQNYEKLQNTILTDAPALFLYNPDFTYWLSGKVKGVDTFKIIDPAKRFINISNWYISTKRTWK